VDKLTTICCVQAWLWYSLFNQSSIQLRNRNHNMVCGPYCTKTLFPLFHDNRPNDMLTRTDLRTSSAFRCKGTLWWGLQLSLVAVSIALHLCRLRCVIFRRRVGPSSGSLSRSLRYGWFVGGASSYLGFRSLCIWCRCRCLCGWAELVLMSIVLSCCGAET
jgi:hypothetical protein